MAKEDLKRIGAYGEECACRYLLSQGLLVMDRNWHYRHTELDIVVREGISHARAIEVKTRFHSQQINLQELIKPRQAERLILAADRYAATHPWVESIQIDLVLVILNGQSAVIEYFPEAVQPEF